MDQADLPVVSSTRSAAPLATLIEYQLSGELEFLIERQFLIPEWSLDICAHPQYELARAMCALPKVGLSVAIFLDTSMALSN